MSFTRAEISRRYRQRHPEKMLAATLKWQTEHPERHREIRRKSVNKHYAKVKNDPAFRKKLRDKNNAYRRTFWGSAKTLLHGAQQRARIAKVAFDLDIDFVVAILTPGVCSVTGLPLVFGERNGPWSPSLDRIIPALGYTRENTRAVAWIYNVSKANYTDADVLKLAQAIVQRNNSYVA